MNKTDIDKFFREKFHEHENSPDSNIKGNWENFGKQLDGKKGGKLINFSFNQWLMFFSSITVLVLIPVLYFNVNDSNDTLSTVKNISVSKRQIDMKRQISQKENINPVIKNKENTPVTEVDNIAQTPVTGLKQKPVAEKKTTAENKIKDELKSENISSAKENIYSAPVAAINKQLPQKEIFATQKDSNTIAQLTDSLLKTANRKPGDTAKKTGLKKRTKVLLPKINYNGF